MHTRGERGGVARFPPAAPSPARGARGKFAKRKKIATNILVFFLLPRATLARCVSFRNFSHARVASTVSNYPLPPFRTIAHIGWLKCQNVGVAWATAKRRFFSRKKNLEPPGESLAFFSKMKEETRAEAPGKEERERERHDDASSHTPDMTHDLPVSARRVTSAAEKERKRTGTPRIFSTPRALIPFPRAHGRVFAAPAPHRVREIVAQSQERSQ